MCRLKSRKNGFILFLVREYHQGMRYPRFFVYMGYAIQDVFQVMEVNICGRKNDITQRYELLLCQC